MKLELHVVPPGGGEVDHVLELSEGQIGHVPRKDEYVTFQEEAGSSAYQVINVHSFYGKATRKYVIQSIVVEAEPVILPEGIASEGHKKLCKSHDVTKEYPETLY